MVSVFQIEFFATVCSFLPVLNGDSDRKRDRIFVFGHLESLEVMNALLIALKMILIYIQALD